MFPPLLIRGAVFRGVEHGVNARGGRETRYLFDIEGKLHAIPENEIYDLPPSPVEIGTALDVEIDGWWARDHGLD